MDVPLEPSSYEAAIFQHSLEHLTDPVAALRRVVDALRPGGLVLITVPNFGGWQARHFGSRWYHLDLPRHRVNFTGEAMTAALEAAGLREATLSTSTSAVGLPASIQYRLARRCLFPAGLPLRVASGLCALLYPLPWLLDRLGGGDLLRVVARRP
jgi:SAM-dependent methyltransferase